MDNKKLVVYTGSFNPVTKAHYLMLNEAINQIGADLGLFVAVSNDYLCNKMIVGKHDTFVLSEEIRKQMLESLSIDNPKIKFWGYELGGASPNTGATIRKIIKQYKGYEVYYLSGADKVKSLGNWKDIDLILNDIKVIICDRNDVDIDYYLNNNQTLNKYKDHFLLLNEIKGKEHISSSLIRNNIYNNLEYKDLMNDGPYNILNSIDLTKFTNKPNNQILIEANIKYGGRFGGNAARKIVYKDNLEIFKNWPSIFDTKANIINNTKAYKSSFNTNSNNSYNTITKVVNMDCADVAEELINEGLNPAILNLASAIKPCGGYSDGMGAQEESLCYMSNLSTSLYQFGNPKYKAIRETINIMEANHKIGVYPLDINYGGVYSKNITFFRHNLNNNYRLREKLFNCSIISVASLANKISDYNDNETIYFNEDGHLNKEGIEIEKNKIRTIFRIALDNNHDSIVLGAFGCGVYNVLPEDCSKLFKEVLEEPEFKSKFKKLVFAIYEGKGSSRKVVGKEGKFKAFYQIFGE